MHAVKQYEAHDGAFTRAKIKRLDTITSALKRWNLRRLIGRLMTGVGSDTR